MKNIKFITEALWREKFIKNVRKTIKTPPPPTPRLPIIPLKKPPSIRIKKSNAFTL